MANTTLRSLTGLGGTAVLNTDLFLVHQFSSNAEYKIAMSDLRYAVGNGAIVFANTVSVTGLTTMSTANVTSNANVGGTLGVAGLTTLSTANITSNAKIGGTLSVTGAVSLTAPLTLANGGTGATNGAGAYAALLGYTSTATAAGTTTLTNASTQYQLFTGTTTQIVVMPVTSTLTAGWTFHIVNNSTGNLTVNSSGGNLIGTVYPNMTIMVTCISTTLATAAAWEFGYTDFGTITGTGNVVMSSGPTITGGAFNGTLGATTPSTIAATTISATGQITSTLATGTAPLSVASTTTVSNLSASYLGGATFAAPSAIGSGTANTGAFTTLSASSTVSGTGFSTYLASPPAIGSSAANSIAATTVTATTSVLSSGSGGVGYSTGAGVAVTQLTSRTTPTPTTGAKTSGAITLFTAAAVVGTYFSFTVPNTGIAATDTVIVTVRGATNTYVAFVSAITAATSFQVTMASVAGTASDTPIVNFTIIKGVSA
jgi:hypothetical protein